jgi:hypothetical protein
LLVQGAHTGYFEFFAIVISLAGRTAVGFSGINAGIRCRATRNLSQIFWHDAALPGTSSYIIRPCRLEPLGQRGEDRWRELLRTILALLETGFQRRCCIFVNPARDCGAPEQQLARYTTRSFSALSVFLLLRYDATGISHRT